MGEGANRTVAEPTRLDRLRFLFCVALPVWAQGILLRRRGVARLASAFGLDGKAIRLMQRFRRNYGEAALLLLSRGRRHVLLLAPSDVKHVLSAAPEPFSPATREKRAALSHYEPHVALATRGPARAVRRKFNDDMLESDRPCHHMARSFTAVVADEASHLTASLRKGAALSWPIFTEAWYAAVRRIVLGDRAGDDRALTEQLSRLRARANWVFLPARRSLRARYYARLEAHLARAEPGSLAALVARRPPHDDERPLDQITQWLFAFDAGGMTAFRALALFASHREQRQKAGADLRAWQDGEANLPYLRAGFLDAVRLWPTTPLILRESTQATPWDSTTLPRGTNLIIYVPFFHRDDERLACADRFDPELWLDRDPAAVMPFVPFSAGPTACPGRHLVAMIGAAWLAALLCDGHYEFLNPLELGPHRPLPRTLDHFSIRLRWSR
jgi:cytochrome P450